MRLLTLDHRLVINPTGKCVQLYMDHWSDKQAHRPINRIGHILEFEMKRGVMHPSTGQRIS